MNILNLGHSANEEDNFDFQYRLTELKKYMLVIFNSEVSRENFKIKLSKKECSKIAQQDN